MAPHCNAQHEPIKPLSPHPCPFTQHPTPNKHHTSHRAPPVPATSASPPRSSACTPTLLPPPPPLLLRTHVQVQTVSRFLSLCTMPLSLGRVRDKWRWWMMVLVLWPHRRGRRRGAGSSSGECCWLMACILHQGVDGQRWTFPWKTGGGCPSFTVPHTHTHAHTPKYTGRCWTRTSSNSPRVGPCP